MNKEQLELKKRLFELRKQGYNAKQPTLKEKILNSLDSNPLIRLLKLVRRLKRN